MEDNLEKQVEEILDDIFFWVGKGTLMERNKYRIILGKMLIEYKEQKRTIEQLEDTIVELSTNMEN